MCYLAGKWNLLPKLLQKSFIAQGRNWGNIHSLNETLTEFAGGRHLPFTDIVWGLRNRYKNLSLAAIRALADSTAEFMHHEIFELVS